MTTYSIDRSHSEIAFSARHMMLTKVRGLFTSWSGELQYDAADPTKSVVSVEVETGSIETSEAKRDAHLRSADFLDAEQFPKMTFKSKRIEPKGENRYALVGDLTVRGATHELTLDVELTGGGKDPWGNQRLGFTATGQLSRAKWGLTWNQALETGGVLVSDKIEIAAEVQVIASAAAA